MWVVLIIGTILLSVGFNSLFFHKDAVPGEPGHYEARVYITRTGDCYHSGSCSYLHSSQIPIGLKAAKNSGYRACSVCGGKSSGQIFVEGTEGEKEENHYIASFFIVSFSVSLWVGCAWYDWIERTESEDKINNINKQSKVVIKPIDSSNYVKDEDLDEDY